MTPEPRLAFAIGLILLACGLNATEPTAETRTWWNHVRALANDSMEGRDTGSDGYLRAAKYVVAAFERSGLRPAGENGYYQNVPLHAVRHRADLSRAELVRNGSARRLTWLHEIRVAASTSLPPTVDAPMVFVGSPGWEREVDAKGKIVVQLTPPPNAPNTREALLTRPPPGAVGVIGIDNVATLEPRRWPGQYSVTLRLRGEAAATYPGLVIAFNPAFADLLFEGLRSHLP